MQRTRAAALMAVLVALSACGPTSTASPSAAPGATSPPAATASAGPTAAPRSANPSAQPSGATLASGDPLPACEPSEPAAADTVTFVASGSAWALSPSGGHLTCLFPIDDAGPFAWGPLGDRALVGRLEVKGVADGPVLGPRNQAFTAVTWSRPTGKSIVYAALDGAKLEKIGLDVAGSTTQDVTPLPASTYESVTYHPSGEAFAFVVGQTGAAAEANGAQSIWMSSNVGKSPVRLVFSLEGTGFGAIGFDVDGKHLFYAAQHADNHADLHSIDVTSPTDAPVVWEGPQGKAILDIEPGLVAGTVAWTSGNSCADSAAMAHTKAGTVAALPAATGPTRSVGWLSATKLLVASGGCDGPLDLAAVDVAISSVAPLVSGVDAAAVRTPVPTPPAALPKAVLTQGSGFS